MRMKGKYSEWFDNLRDEFVEQFDRDPNKDEWTNHVVLELGDSSDAPIACEVSAVQHRASISRFASQGFSENRNSAQEEGRGCKLV